MRPVPRVVDDSVSRWPSPDLYAGVNDAMVIARLGRRMRADAGSAYFRMSAPVVMRTLKMGAPDVAKAPSLVAIRMRPTEPPPPP